MASHRWLVPIIAIGTVIGGISAGTRLPVERVPDLRGPVLTASADWPGASPEMVEQRLTRVLEQSANSLPDVKSITSRSREGYSQVSVEFKKGGSVDFRQVEWMENLIQLRGRLPPGASLPEITREVPESLTESDRFMVLSVTGSGSTNELTRIADQMLRPGLLVLEGLSGVKVFGQARPVVAVSFDRTKLQHWNVPTALLLQELHANSTSTSVGQLIEGNRRRPVRQESGALDLKSIRESELIESTPNRGLQIGDFTEVEISDEPHQEIRRIFGKPSITLHLIKQPGYDALGLSEQVSRRLNELKKQLPQGVNVLVAHDETRELRVQLKALYRTTLLSLLILTVILVLMTRSWKASLLILVNVICIYGLTLTILLLIGVSLNMYTMAGLTISLGMVLDNAVVMADEFISRGDQFSEAPTDVAFARHLEEVRIPVLAATLTTVGIMAPILFAKENLRPMLEPFFLAMVIALLCSIGLSFLTFPAAWLRSVRGAGDFGKGAPGEMPLAAKSRSALTDTAYTTLHPHQKPHNPLYVNVLRIRWRLRALILFLSAAVLILGFWSATNQTIRLTGKPSREDVIVASFQTSPGTPFEELDRLVKRFEEAALPYKATWTLLESSASARSGSGRVSVLLHSEHQDSDQAHLLFGDWMVIATTLGNVVTRLAGLGDGHTTEAGGVAASFQYRLSGHSYDQLNVVAEQISQELKSIRGIRRVQLYPDEPDESEDMRQILLKPDLTQIVRDGFEPDSILPLIRYEFSGFSSYGEIQLGGRQIPIVESSANAGPLISVAELHSHRVSISGVPHRIRDWVSVSERSLPSVITRKDQSYTLLLDVEYRGAEVRMKPALERVLNRLNLPHGVRLESADGSQSSASASTFLSSMSLALGTVLIVGFILAALLEDASRAAMSLAALPFSAAGVFIGLFLRELEWSPPVLAGLLLTIGIAVNNVILLLHHLGRMEVLNSTVGKQGQVDGVGRLPGNIAPAWDIWSQTLSRSSRVILTTTLTTLGGLIPMIFHEPGSHWSLLAETVAWGLAFGTLFLFLLAGIHANPRQGSEYDGHVVQNQSTAPAPDGVLMEWLKGFHIRRLLSGCS